ncbi:MAG TPA: hypothetical protein VEZ20_05480 [Allosphingosinicella sp.]|nr:hypothetical protein [Allosphingosinicella sp.]
MNKLACIIAAACAAAAFASPAAAADLTLDASTGFTIPVEIRQQIVNLRVDPESSGYPIFNPATAARLGFRGSLFGARATVGPVRISGEQNGAKFRIAAIPRSYRFAFFDRDIVEGAEGIISPHELPYDNVVFRLRDPQPGEVETRLQMAFNRAGGLYAPLVLGDRTVFVEFSLLQPHSLATASAGALVAASHGGEWSGEARPALIKFGIERPIRPMRLARPLEIGGFALSALHVRTGDHRGNFQLPPDAAPPPSSEAGQDPDEIVVTGNVQRGRARLYTTIGLDRLSACSSLTYTQATKTLTLRCLPLA